jgi:hypothetical protein
MRLTARREAALAQLKDTAPGDLETQSDLLADVAFMQVGLRHACRGLGARGHPSRHIPLPPALLPFCSPALGKNLVRSGIMF